jgi:hypothetical protein
MDEIKSYLDLLTALLELICAFVGILKLTKSKNKRK